MDSLSGKIRSGFGAFLAIISVTTLFIYFIHSYVVLPNFAELERAEAINNFERASAALRSQMDFLRQSSGDYAIWDEMYDYLGSRSHEFEDKNLDWSTFHSNLKIDLALVADNDGKIIWGDLYPQEEPTPPIEQPSASALFILDKAVKSSAKADGGVGLLRLKEGFLVFGVTKVIRPNAPLSPNGFVVLGRLLSAGLMENLSNQIKLDFKLVETERPESEPSVEVAGENVLTVRGPAPLVVGGQSIGLSITMDRPFYTRGMQMTKVLSAAIACFGVLLSLAGMFIVTQLNRLGESQKKLAASVSELNEEIGNREKAEGALSASIAELASINARQVALYSAMPDLIFLNSKNGVFLDFRARSIEDLLFPPESFIGKTVQEIFPEEIGKQSLEAIRRAIDSGKMSNFEYQLDMGGVPHHYEARIVRVSDDEAVTICRDMTETVVTKVRQKELEDRLAQARKMEAIGTLAGGVAHEFNNILQILSGRMDLIKLEGGVVSAGNIQGIEKSIDRAKSLVTSLLTYAHKLEPEKVPVSLSERLAQNIAFIGPAMPKNIVLSLDNSQCSATVLADPAQLDQIFLNVVSNARDAMENGGEIIVSTGRSPTDARFLEKHPGARGPGYGFLRISDSGCGIEREYLDKIFDPFFTTKDIGSGTGLGLSIVHGIVSEHGGFIDLESEPGSGTTFTIHLPLADADADAINAGDAPTTQGQAVSGTLLLVEDEADIAEMLKMQLRMVGYEVITAQSGEEGLEKYFGPVNVDLVVMDLGMPGMGGQRFLAILKEKDPGAKAIVVTGYGQGVASSLDPKPDAFLCKPYKLSELIDTIGKIIR